VRLPPEGGDGDGEPGDRPGGEHDEVANGKQGMASGVSESGCDGPGEWLGGKVALAAGEGAAPGGAGDDRAGRRGYALPASWSREAPVMTGPGDEKAAVPADRCLQRASHADREQVIHTLKAAFVQGRLTKDEFDARVGQVFGSRTYGELAAVTDDIPAGPIRAQSPPEAARAQARPPENTRLKTSVGAITAATGILAGAWMGAWFAHVDDPKIIGLLVSLTVVFLGAWLVTGSVALLESRQEKPSGRQLPPQSTPSAGDRAGQHPASSAPAEQLPPTDSGQQYSAVRLGSAADHMRAVIGRRSSRAILLSLDPVARR
jgi:hypothetical protein